MSKKVYCKDCAFFTMSMLTGVSDCAYDDNIIMEKVDDWYSKREEIFYKRRPLYINANNNCEWFKMISKTSDTGQRKLQ